MPVGAEFYTDSGVIQIDENWPCLCLKSIGTATVVNRHPASLNTSAHIAKTVDITVTGQTPLMAIAGPGSYGVIAITQSGSNWTFRVIGYDHNPTFTYFIYDKPSATPSGAGMEVYDASGNVVFSSLWRTMEVVGFLGGSQTANVNLNPSRQYAVLCNAIISVYENSEHFTNGEIWTYWTYNLTTGYTGASTIGGTDKIAGFTSAAIAGGVNEGGSGPVDPSGDLGGWGSGNSMLVVDVTDYVAPITGNGPVVSVNATSRTATGTGSGTTITDAITANATGGQGGPYSYQWDRVSGDVSIVAYGATNQAALRTQAVNQPSSTNWTSKWICRGTDSQGLSNYSQEVTMNHIQPAAVDVTPNPVTWPAQTWSTNSESVYGAYSATGPTITGINQNIVLRFQVIALTSSASAQHFYVSGNADYASITNYGLNSYVDVTVPNGLYIQPKFTVLSSSGIRISSGTIRVTNLSTGAQMGDFTFSITVDADNNYNNSDFTPNALNWANISGSTNDASFSVSNASLTISGINQPIVLRGTVTGLSKTSNITSSSRLDVYRNGSYFHNSSTLNNGAWTEVTVSNGQTVNFYAQAGTTAGVGSLSYTVTVTNQSTGGTVLDTFTVSQTVDADNNYNVTPVNDYTPDSFTLPTINGSVNENDYSWSSDWYGTCTVTGINQPITVRFERYDYSGNLDGLYIDVFTWPPGASSWTFHGYYDARGTGLGYIDVPNVVNGTKIAYNPHAVTNSGTKSGQCRFVLWSLQPNVQFATSSMNYFTVDADNNYNVSTGNGPFTMNGNLSAYGSNGYGEDMRVGSVLTANQTLYVSTSMPTGTSVNRSVGFSLWSTGGAVLYFSWGGNEVKNGVLNVLAGQTINSQVEIYNTSAYGSNGFKTIQFDVFIKNAAGTTLCTFNVYATAPAEGSIEA